MGRIQNRRNKLILTHLIIIVITFTACKMEKSVTDASSNQEMITITDCIGREVQVPKNVERIASIFATSGHIVTMLGKGNQIVAISNGLTRDKVLNEISPPIKNAVIVKGGGHFNIEELIKADPDVVFFSTDVINDHATQKKINQLGIPYLIVEYKTIEQQQYAVEMIGKAIGQEERAKTFNKYYDDCIARVTERIQDIPDEDRIRIYHAINEVARTDSSGTLPAEWTKIAGAKNVSSEENQGRTLEDSLKLVDGKFFVSFEQICLWNPEAIIANGDGIDLYLKTKNQFKEVEAVKKDKVYLLPNGISRWGHPTSIETPLAILWTAQTLYPDKFQDIDISAETKKFYHEFFSYDLSEDQVKQILSGKGMRKPKKR